MKLSHPFAATVLQLAGSALVLGLAAGHATAAPSALVTFTSLSVTSTGGTLLWSAPDAYQSLYVQVDEAGGIGGHIEQAYDAGNLAASSVGAATANAAGSVSVGVGQSFSVAASATPSFFASFAYPNSATSSGSLSGAFSLSAPGTVTFTVGYLVSASAPGGDAIDDFATALARLNVGNYATGVDVSREVSLQSFDVASGFNSAVGTFTVSVAMANANQVGYYTMLGAGTAVAAAVPEPHALAMLLAGLGGTGLWMRRQRRLG